MSSDRSIHAKQRGAILPLATIAMVVLFGFLALAIDVGFLMWRKSQYQTALDAAALSAAHCKFIKGKNNTSSEQCGNETFQHNMQAFGLSDYLATRQNNTTKAVSKITYKWENNSVLLTKKSQPIATFFAGAFFTLLSPSDAQTPFEINLTSKAGLLAPLNTPDILPLVIGWRNICKNLSGPCSLDDFRLGPVRAWAIMSPQPKADEDLKWSAQKIFDWLAGDPASQEKITLEQKYLICVNNDCEKNSGLSGVPGDLYEDGIEDGLETRMKCGNDDGWLELPDLDDDRRDDYPYTCRRDDKGQISAGFYPPDVFKAKLDTSGSTPYVRYFKKTETDCIEPNEQGCWQSDDDGTPESYRRVIIAGVGNVNIGTSTASIATYACFALVDADDPGKIVITNGITLAYIPQHSPEAQRAGCLYGENLKATPAQHVVLMGEA